MESFLVVGLLGPFCLLIGVVENPYAADHQSKDDQAPYNQFPRNAAASLAHRRAAYRQLNQRL